MNSVLFAIKLGHKELAEILSLDHQIIICIFKHNLSEGLTEGRPYLVYSLESILKFI